MAENALSFTAPILVFTAGLAALVSARVLSHVIATWGFLPDFPNERSSHTSVASRGGGIAIWASWLIGLSIILLFANSFEVTLNTLKFAALASVAFLLGLCDDRFSLGALPKLIAQIALGALFVMSFGALELAPAPFIGEISLGSFGAVITVLWIVGFMNVFNFMDGINGLASACGLFVLSMLAVVSATFGAPLWGIASLLFALSLLGFLPVNLKGGRLFMGDSGSLMLSFVIASVAILAANATQGKVSAYFVPTAMAPFIFDVGYTLIKRAVRKQDILKAHREHLYQKLVQTGRSHGYVTALYLIMVSLSSTAAILMLRLSPDAQWLAPLIVFALLAASVVAVKRSIDQGSYVRVALDEATVESLPDNQSNEPQQFPRAAE